MIYVDNRCRLIKSYCFILYTLTFSFTNVFVIQAGRYGEVVSNVVSSNKAQCPEFGVDDVSVDLKRQNESDHTILLIPRNRLLVSRTNADSMESYGVALLGGDLDPLIPPSSIDIFTIDRINYFSIIASILPQSSLQQQFEQMNRFFSSNTTPELIQAGDAGYLPGITGYSYRSGLRSLYVRLDHGRVIDLITCAHLEALHPICDHDISYRNMYISFNYKIEALASWIGKREWVTQFMNCAVQEK